MIYGDGVQSRDFTFVANAVQANLLAAANEQPLAGEVINVGCGARISVNELASAMASALGRPDLKPAYEPPRAGDILHSFADLSAPTGCSTISRSSISNPASNRRSPGTRWS